MGIVAISGSRNEQGQTARALKAYLGGMEEAGQECERYYLPVMNLERCRQCDADGWGLCRREGRCVIEDDFAELVEKVQGAEKVVFATPVYFSDLSESMRGFLDRLRRVVRFAEERGGLEGKEAAVICVAGGGGGGAPTCVHQMDLILRTIGFEVMDAVCVRRQNLAWKEKVLRLAGKLIEEK
jgi:multimeric flavodoxin WrbA